MPPGYITIPRSEFEAVLRALRDAADSTRSGGALYERIAALAPLLLPPRVALALTLEASEMLARHISRIDGKLREFDVEMTPMRPPSHADIQAAFQSSVAFAQGTKKASKP